MATASIPSKAASVVSEKNRDTIPATITSKCMFYRLTDGTGTDFVDSAGQFVGMPITGGTDWATNETYFTPDGSNNYAALTVEQTDSIFDLSDIPNGCLLVLFDVKTAAGNPGTNMRYFEYGDGSQGLGMYRQSGTTSVRFEYFTAGSSNTTFSAVNIDTSQRNSLGGLWDRKNNALTGYKNGDTGGWNTAAFADTDFTDSENAGLRLFERTTGTADSDIPMSNFLAIKFDAHPGATTINKIITDHWENRGMWSWALEGK